MDGWELKRRTVKYESARLTALLWFSGDISFYVPESLNHVSAGHVGLRHAGGSTAGFFFILFPTELTAIFGPTFHETMRGGGGGDVCVGMCSGTVTCM